MKATEMEIKNFKKNTLTEVNETLNQMEWLPGEAEAIHAYIEDGYNVDFINSGIVHQFHPKKGRVIKLSPNYPPTLEESDFRGNGVKVGWNY